MPVPVPWHIGQVPRQPPYRPGIGRVGHQGHCHGHPDRELERHQPLPLRRRHPPGRDARRDQVLDHPLAQVPFQLTKAHMIRQPAAGPDHAVPAGHRRRDRHRMGEHHHLARGHPPAGGHQRACPRRAARPGHISCPHRDHPGRQPGRELRGPAPRQLAHRARYLPRAASGTVLTCWNGNIR